MQELTGALLELSRVSTHGGGFAPVDLAAVARGVAGELEGTIRDTGAAVRVDELPTIDADAPQCDS